MGEPTEQGDEAVEVSPEQGERPSGPTGASRWIRQQWSFLASMKRGAMWQLAAWLIGATIVIHLTDVVDGGWKWPWPPIKWGWLSALIDAATFVVALGVGLAEARERWEAQLPRRLTIVFLLDNKEANGPMRLIMCCEEASLAHPGDIRNWGLQLGQQMAVSARGQRNLDLSPKLNIEPPTLETDAEGEHYWLHRATMYLTKEPESVVEPPDPWPVTWTRANNFGAARRQPNMTAGPPPTATGTAGA